MNEYSSLKAAWHLEDIKKLRQGEQIAPKQVQLVISDLCNQDCSFCHYRRDDGFSIETFRDGEIKNPNRKIPFEKVIEILDDCKAIGVKAIEFTGGGEPTVHPKFVEIIEHAQAIGLETALITNGIRIKPNPIYEKMKWIRVSLDAGVAKTYSDMRRSDTFDKALKAIHYLGTLDGPYVGVGFIVTPENYKEIVTACEYVKEFGIPYVRIAAAYSYSGSEPYKDLDVSGEIKKAKMLEDRSFRIVDLYCQRINELNIGNPVHKFCGYQQFTMHIGGNLKVHRCCTIAYTKHGEVGDLTNQRLIDWFYSEQKKEAYRDFDGRSCHHCQFRDQNELINYLVSEPDHVNYV